jgi:hypothetical protein
MFKAISNWISDLFMDQQHEKSSKERENLTEDEKLFMARSLAKSDYKAITCPDCEKAELSEGPSGGCSVNMACWNCGSEFNITVSEGHVIGERISDRGPRDLGSRAHLYNPN